MSNLPKIAKIGSIKIEVKEGEKYFWCSCGLSENQPFCDGSHKGTGFGPVIYQAQEDKIVGFCGCKASKMVLFVMDPIKIYLKKKLSN